MTRKDSLKKAINPFGKVVLILLLIVTLLAVIPKETHASLFDDFINEMNNKLKSGVDGVKSLVSPSANNNVRNNSLSVESDIKLAPDGDVNKNGQIDAGDTITFTYNIQNNTDKKYAYATLKTNIQRDSLNFIHNVSGVTGLKDDGKTIEFPNLRVLPKTVKVISFDAKINFFTEQDPTITTEPELVTEDKKSVLKSEKKQIQGKRIKKEDIPNQIKMFKKNESSQDNVANVSSPDQISSDSAKPATAASELNEDK